MSKERQNQSYQSILTNLVGNIRLLRKHREISNKQLAEATGYSNSYICSLSSPKMILKKRPNLEYIVSVADALGTTPGKLLDSSPPDFDAYVKSLLANDK